MVDHTCIINNSSESRIDYKLLTNVPISINFLWFSLQLACFCIVAMIHRADDPATTIFKILDPGASCNYVLGYPISFHHVKMKGPRHQDVTSWGLSITPQLSHLCMVVKAGESQTQNRVVLGLGHWLTWININYRMYAYIILCMYVYIYICVCKYMCK